MIEGGNRRKQGYAIGPSEATAWGVSAPPGSMGVRSTQEQPSSYGTAARPWTGKKGVFGRVRPRPPDMRSLHFLAFAVALLGAQACAEAEEGPR